jgi:hypothetical protein
VKPQAVYWFVDSCNAKGGGPTDGYRYKCEPVPRKAVCSSCHFLRPRWYPKPPPTVRLHLSYQALQVVGMGVMVVHEALFDILNREWPDALTTRCSSHPQSPLRIGERYLAVSVPPRAKIDVYNEGGSFWQCKACQNWVFGGGPWINRYTVFRDDQLDLNVFNDTSQSLYVRPSVRDQIEAIKLSRIYWQKIAIKESLKPHHRLPGVNCPPLAPGA